MIDVKPSSPILFSILIFTYLLLKSISTISTKYLKFSFIESEDAAVILFSKINKTLLYRFKYFKLDKYLIFDNNDIKPKSSIELPSLFSLFTR